jgi:hypothetical protein
MLVGVDVTDDEIELLRPWLDEFDTSLVTNVADSIVHELLTRIVDHRDAEKNNLQN